MKCPKFLRLILYMIGTLNKKIFSMKQPILLLTRYFMAIMELYLLMAKQEQEKLLQLTVYIKMQN